MCLLPFLLCLASFALSAVDSFYNQDNTLFDIGIAKVLGKPSFWEFPLDDIRRTFSKIFDFHVRLSQGKLYGLPSFQRWDRSYINVTDSGITALLKVQGGPLQVSYTGTVRSIPVDARVDVNIYIPWIGLFIYVEEPEPNSLRLAELRLRTDRVTFRVNKLDGDSLFFDFLRWLAEGRIGEAVRDNMGEIMTEVVHQFLGKVELFARNGTKFGDIRKPRPDATFTPVFVLPGMLDRIYPSNNPLGPWDDPNKWGIFDYSIKRMAVASKLDPVVFTDVNDVSWNDWSFHIWNVTVDGLAYLRRGGDNYAVVDRCGLNARVHLAMENIKVQLYATTDIVGVTLRLRIDVRIVGVDVVLKVKEKNKAMEMEDYQLTFPVPVEYDVYVLNPLVGPLLQLLNGYTKRSLTEDEANKLEDHSRKYLERAIATVTEFIKDPAPWMPWDNSIIDAYRRYIEEHKS